MLSDALPLGSDNGGGGAVYGPQLPVGVGGGLFGDVVRSHQQGGGILLGSHVGPPSPQELPAPTLASLPELARVLSECSQFTRERLAGHALRRGYLRKLLDVFKMCEDLDDAEGCAGVARVVKALVLLNDTALLEALVSAEHFLDVVGALEYDPEAPPAAARPGHRAFFQTGVRFKEVVPIASPDTRAKIHATYRLTYLRDTALAHGLDDATHATLSSLALFNHVEVVHALQAEPSFLRDLFSRLGACSPGSPAWRDLVAFLQEMTSMARHLQGPHRARLFASLAQHGVFEAITLALAAPLASHAPPSHAEPPGRGMQPQAQRSAANGGGGGSGGGGTGGGSAGAAVSASAATAAADASASAGGHAAAADILGGFICEDASGLRSFLLKQPGRALFSQLISHVLGRGASEPGASPCEGLQSSVVEILKALLDPADLGGPVEKSEFLEVFYDAYIGQLVDAVVQGGAVGGGESGVGSSSVPSLNPDIPPLPPPPHASSQPASQPASQQFASQPFAAPGGAAAAAEPSDAPQPPLPPLPPTAAPQPHPPAPSGSHPPPTAATLVLVLDLLCYCVRYHTYRIKYFVLRHNVRLHTSLSHLSTPIRLVRISSADTHARQVVDKVMRLTRRREAVLQCAAVRLLRTAVELKDDFYHRHLVKQARVCGHGMRRVKKK